MFKKLLYSVSILEYQCKDYQRRTEVDAKDGKNTFYFIWFFFFVCVFCLFRAAPMAYGSSQARGQSGAIAAGLCHNCSNAGSEPRL